MRAKINFSSFIEILRCRCAFVVRHCRNVQAHTNECEYDRQIEKNQLACACQSQVNLNDNANRARRRVYLQLKQQLIKR